MSSRPFSLNRSTLMARWLPWVMYGQKYCLPSARLSSRSLGRKSALSSALRKASIGSRTPDVAYLVKYDSSTQMRSAMLPAAIAVSYLALMSRSWPLRSSISTVTPGWAALKSSTAAFHQSSGLPSGSRPVSPLHWLQVHRRSAWSVAPELGAGVPPHPASRMAAIATPTTGIVKCLRCIVLLLYDATIDRATAVAARQGRGSVERLTSLVKLVELQRVPGEQPSADLLG